MHSADDLKALPATREFFIGIDSDGCVFDTMEVKQKECFCPNFIRHFGLQAASKYAREVWEFVNLYSKTRGCNRFPAVARALDLMAERPEFAARRIPLPPMTAMRAWVQKETKLGNPALKKLADETGDGELKRLLAWSEAVNADIEKTVHDIPPFPFFEEAIKRAAERADLVVVSQTPFAALDREWKENGIDRHVRFIAGQECGTKTEHLRFAAGGKYAPGRVLMIGDAEGDLKAARANQALFFPIVPGAEEASWERFAREGLDRFLNQTFAGTYQESLLAEFDAALPDVPPWKR